MWAIKNVFIISAVYALTQAATTKSNNLEESFQLTESQEINEVTESQPLEPSNDCVIGCPRILDPICAVDETTPKTYKYFHNQCLMESESCLMGKAWRPTQMLLCMADVEPLLRADCMRACPLIYNPICASDGKNYEIFANQCIFGIEKCLDSDKWLVVRSAHCGF